jgi:YesN/AraC family two-component response regulator
MINIKLLKELTHDLSVLYVQNDISLMEDTSELLENYFKKVDTEYDGQAGFDKYIAYEKENGKPYDLIISDINMPKLNGIAMSKKIRAMNHEQFIVIITAHNEVEFLSSALDLGIDGYVTKPIENLKLIKVLYKVAQAITNNKFVESHIQVVEDLNMQLDIQNKELASKNKELHNKNQELEKSFRMLIFKNKYNT